MLSAFPRVSLSRSKKKKRISGCEAYEKVNESVSPQCKDQKHTREEKLSTQMRGNGTAQNSNIHRIQILLNLSVNTRVCLIDGLCSFGGGVVYCHE
jgi:hypothetical protein